MDLFINLLIYLLPSLQSIFVKWKSLVLLVVVLARYWYFDNLAAKLRAIFVLLGLIFTDQHVHHLDDTCDMIVEYLFLLAPFKRTLIRLSSPWSHLKTIYEAHISNHPRKLIPLGKKDHQTRFSHCDRHPRRGLRSRRVYQDIRVNSHAPLFTAAIVFLGHDG